MNIVDMFKALTLLHKVAFLGISGLVIVCVIMMYRVLKKPEVTSITPAERLEILDHELERPEEEKIPRNVKPPTVKKKKEIKQKKIFKRGIKYTGRKCAVCGSEEGYLYLCEKCREVLCEKHKGSKFHDCDPSKIEKERMSRGKVEQEVEEPTELDKIEIREFERIHGELKTYVTEDGVLRNSRHGPLHGERIRKIGKIPGEEISKEEVFRELRDSRRKIIEKAKRMFPIKEEKKEEVKHSLMTQEETEHNKYKCQYCGMYANKLYKCRRCGGEFCMEHRLTKNHECPVKKTEKEYRVYVGLKWMFGEPFVEHNLWVKSIK